MRISVRSRNGSKGSEPCSFCLGRRALYVTGIVERRELAGARRFEVRVADGRRFVILHRPSADSWELAAVYLASRSGRVARRGA